MIELWKARKVVLCSSLASAHPGAILCRLVVRGECVERCNFDAAPEGQQTHHTIEQGKLSAEEYATLKRLVEKRVREAAQVTAVTRDDTVQHCSPISQPSVPPSGVCCNLENEGRLDPESEKLKSSSASTGLNTPGQQCHPNEGIRETGRTTASGTLTAGASSSKKRNISTSTGTVAGISSTATTSGYLRLKTFSEENKQFDPGGQGEKARLGTRLYSILSFLGRAGKLRVAFCLCLVLCAFCVFVFRNYFFSTGDHFSAKLKDGTRVLDADRVADVRNRRASVLLPITLLKLARTSNARFGRSADTLE